MTLRQEPEPAPPSTSPTSSTRPGQALDMAVRGDKCPAVIIHTEPEPPARQPVRAGRARLQRRA